MPTLTWTRKQDGEHNGRPCYDYDAVGKDGVRYNITWAYDHGGTFGYTAYDAGGQQAHRGVSIQWAGTLGRCKDACEAIERSREVPIKLVPNYAGQFSTFEDWVNTATRKLANKTCESSLCTVSVPAVCVDTKGRRCCQGSDFERARDEGCFPVRFFWDCKPE